MTGSVVSEDSPDTPVIQWQVMSWGIRGTCCDYTDTAGSDMVHVCGPHPRLITHGSVLITIDHQWRQTGRGQVSMFQIPGIFHKLMLQPMTYLKCEGSYIVRKISFKQSGWRCYKWQQIQRGNYGLRENMFMSIVFYWKSFILTKYCGK